MKKLIFFLLALTIAFAGCKKDKDDDETVDEAFNKITITKTQEAFVMLTTATWCTYCGQWGIPTFDEAFAGESGIDANKVNGAALHYSGSDPMHLTMSETLKTEFGIGGPPNLWIEFDNSYNLQPDGWKSAVKARQSGTNPSCAVGLYKENDGSNIKVYAKVKFYSTLSGTYNLAIYVTESGIIESQTGSTTPNNHDHKEVLRGEVTANSPWGVQMFTGSSPEEFTKEFSYTPSGVDVSNIKFVAVVYKMDNGKPIESTNSNSL
ncbi:Omp28-related outer membrane protein [Bacteroidota bacterium]